MAASAMRVPLPLLSPAACALNSPAAPAIVAAGYDGLHDSLYIAVINERLEICDDQIVTRLDLKP